MIVLTQDSEQPLFMAELLGHIGCKVSLPSSRGPKRYIPRGSEEEREADIALLDPKNSKPTRKGRGGSA